MTKRIGLVPMSAKPYHAGHDGLVRIAASQCDVVHLFVSLSDRVRPGELPILGSAMKVLWEKYIEPSLPSNVVVTYGGSPVGNLYLMLGEADKNRSRDTYAIYSDAEDILKYTDKSLSTYAPFLFEKNQIELEGIDRSQTVDVSGTKMRAALSSGDTKEFAKNLPAALQPHAQEIIEILSDTSSMAGSKSKTKERKKSLQSEIAIREYVRLMLEDTVSGVKDIDSPFGISFSGTDTAKLAQIFFRPFLDLYKIGKARVKNLAVRTKTLVQVSLGAITSTFVPGMGARYADIFDQEKKELEGIKAEYKDVYDRINKSFENGDAALLAFMSSPALFLGYHGAKSGLKIGRDEGAELLSAVTGGYSDKLFDKIKAKSSKFGRWLLQGPEIDSSKNSEISKNKKEKTRSVEGKRISSSVDAFANDQYQPLVEAKSEEKYQAVYDKILAVALESPAAKKAQSEARRIYLDSLESIFNQAKEVKNISTLEGIEKFLKQSEQSKNADAKTRQATKDAQEKIQEIKGLQDQKEKLSATEILVKGIQMNFKKFYVDNLKGRLNMLVSSGIPEESQMIKDYKEYIQKISSL